MAAGVRVALVHEWLLTHGGSEEITAELQALFPEADQFALVAAPVPSLRRRLSDRPIRTSFLQWIPGATRWHRPLLPLMPRAIESLDLRGYDLIVSVSHAVAKSVRTAPGQVHLCLCCSPMRYAWDLRESYLREAGLDRGLRGWVVRRLLDRVQAWDRRTADRPTAYLAISTFIADRIHRAYGRESTVLYPPVDTAFFTPAAPTEGVGRDGERAALGSAPWVTASRFVPYKRIPLVVEAFAGMPERTLVVIGDGPERARVQAAARGAANIRLLGQVPRDALRAQLRSARGFVFAAEEDFGIAPVEAMACGIPVVAFGQGGVRETIVPLGAAAPATGVFFDRQEVGAIRAAVATCDTALSDGRLTAAACRARAERFSVDAFHAGMRAAVGRVAQRLVAS